MCCFHVRFGYSCSFCNLFNFFCTLFNHNFSYFGLCLRFCICTRKQWVSFSQNKTLQQKPDVLLRPSSATKINVVRSFKTYDFCQYNSELLPLEKVCKWKDLFVRISHLQRNWADGLYTVKPVLRGHAQPVTCMDCDGRVTLFAFFLWSLVISALAVVYQTVETLQGNMSWN